MNESQRGLLSLILVCLLGLLVVAGIGWLAEQPQSDQVLDTWSYAQLLHQAQAGQVRDLTVSGDTGRWIARGEAIRSCSPPTPAVSPSG
ncbi:MAG TPA: hypothetical protein VKY90_04955 [Candidatus Dormibacteraeota bacterium]|nr:hypothetical protein [Candidatus Dormibacteraeota bacterium]